MADIERNLDDLAWAVEHLRQDIGELLDIVDELFPETKDHIQRPVVHQYWGMRGPYPVGSAQAEEPAAEDERGGTT